MRNKKKREIAPRLISGERRTSTSHGLPPNIKRGLQMIAFREGQSLSWVLEQVLIPAFGLRVPKYKKQKRTTVLPFRKRRTA